MPTWNPPIASYTERRTKRLAVTEKPIRSTYRLLSNAKTNSKASTAVGRAGSATVKYILPPTRSLVSSADLALNEPVSIRGAVGIGKGKNKPARQGQRSISGRTSPLLENGDDACAIRRTFDGFDSAVGAIVGNDYLERLSRETLGIERLNATGKPL